MSFELLSKLESKIQSAVDTIELLKLELEDEKQKNVALKEEISLLESGDSSKNDLIKDLEERNKQLEEETKAWNEKLNGLVGLLNDDAEVTNNPSDYAAPEAETDKKLTQEEAQKLQDHFNKQQIAQELGVSPSEPIHAMRTDWNN